MRLVFIRALNSFHLHCISSSLTVLIWSRWLLLETFSLAEQQQTKLLAIFEMSVTQYEKQYHIAYHIVHQTPQCSVLKQAWECNDFISMWMWWCQSANCVLKHYSELLSLLDMSSQLPIYWCIKVTNWSHPSSDHSFLLDYWNGHYRCWCIICLQYSVANGLTKAIMLRHLISWEKI